MSIKKLLASAVLLTSVVTLAACGGAKEETKTSEAASSQAASSSSSEASETSSAAAVELKDGTYSAESDFDEHGFKAVHTITVAEGKITESKFDYEDKDGALKSENEEYNKNMEAKAGVSAKDAIDQLNAKLVETQDVSKVEVVSGASHTSHDFVTTTEAVLKAASEGNTETVQVTLAAE